MRPLSVLTLFTISTIAGANSATTVAPVTSKPSVPLNRPDIVLEMFDAEFYGGNRLQVEIDKATKKINFTSTYFHNKCVNIARVPGSNAVQRLSSYRTNQGLCIFYKEMDCGADSLLFASDRDDKETHVANAFRDDASSVRCIS